MGASLIGGLVAWVVTSPFTLMFAEAFRHDGWIGVPDDQPLYLYRGPPLRREWMRVRIRDLNDRNASWADGAVVRSDEGGLSLLDRAPLNRRGLSVQFAVGLHSHLSAAQRVPVFGGRLSLGAFPHHRFGLVVHGFMAGSEYLLSGGLAGDVQVFPFERGHVHFGVYGRVGFRRFSDDLAMAPSRRQTLGGGGLILQLEASTRAAVEFQLGVYATERRVFPEVTVGFSVF